MKDKQENVSFLPDIYKNKETSAVILKASNKMLYVYIFAKASF